MVTKVRRPVPIFSFCGSKWRTRRYFPCRGLKTLILIQRPDHWEQVPANGKTLSNAEFVVRAKDPYTVVRVNMRRGSTSVCGFTWTS